MWLGELIGEWVGCRVPRIPQEKGPLMAGCFCRLGYILAKVVVSLYIGDHHS